MATVLLHCRATRAFVTSFGTALPMIFVASPDNAMAQDGQRGAIYFQVIDTSVNRLWPSRRSRSERRAGASRRRVTGGTASLSTSTR